MKKNLIHADIYYDEINSAIALRDLHDLTSEHSQTLARAPGEHTLEDFQADLEKSKSSGINIGAYYKGELIGFIYCYRSEFKTFKHQLANLTIAVHPEYQANGIGRELIKRLVNQALQDNSILRIELYTPSTNQSAIKLYESVGFITEGVLRKRALVKNQFIDDLVMAWTRQ